MARPKLGDSESKRLQMVITEDELEAIDEWQHANRVASRSDAIRRLVQIGLRVDGEILLVIRQAVAAADVADGALKSVLDMYREKGEPRSLDATTLAKVVETLTEEVGRVKKHQDLLTNSLFDMLSEIAPLKNAPKYFDIEEALKLAQSRKEERTRF